MKVKTQTHYKLNVRFYIDEGEEETLTLLVDCMTPRNLKNFHKKLTNSDLDFDGMVDLNCSVVVDWCGVFDEDGAEIPFSKKKLKDFQETYWGLADAIVRTISEESADLRSKRSSVLEQPSD